MKTRTAAKSERLHLNLVCCFVLCLTSICVCIIQVRKNTKNNDDDHHRTSWKALQNIRELDNRKSWWSLFNDEVCVVRYWKTLQTVNKYIVPLEKWPLDELIIRFVFTILVHLLRFIRGLFVLFFVHRIPSILSDYFKNWLIISFNIHWYDTLAHSQVEKSSMPLNRRNTP